jgi:stringent starvation protein B
MKNDMPPLPRKKAVALDLLERTSVFVHLDPRRPSVIVPQGFLKQPQLVLQIGLNMAISIPDLDVTDEGITCTLSFNKRPHFCSLPWSSIYALIGEQGGGMVWPDDVPPEVVSQQRSAAKKDPRARKMNLRAVGGDSADRNASADEPSTQRSGSEVPAAGSKEGRAPSSRPPRLVQVVSNPKPAPAASGSSAAPQQVAAKANEPDSKKPDSTTRSQDEASRPPANKPSRPPYLRLVD